MAKSRLSTQEQETIPGTDTEMSRLCDKFLDARDGVEQARKDFHAIEKEMIRFMREKGKKSVKHGGVTIRQVHQEEKDKIQVVVAE